MVISLWPRRHVVYLFFYDIAIDKNIAYVSVKVKNKIETGNCHIMINTIITSSRYITVVVLNAPQ